MSSETTPRGRGSQARTTDIDELLERVRALQRLLPTPERQRLIDGAGQQTPPEAGEHRYCSRAPTRRAPPQKHRTMRTKETDGRINIATDSNDHREVQRLSPELLPVVADHDGQLTQSQHSGAGSSSSTNDLGVTLDLLQQVTFVRVVIDSLIWQKPPSLLSKELTRNVSPRDKGQLFIEYQFPTRNDDFETLKRRVRAVAKTALPTVAHFNHRRVALVKISPSLVSCWSKGALWLRIGLQIPGRDKHSLRHIGRCHLPLDQLLSVPFHVEKALTIEPLHGHTASGTLKVCVQLGSRLPSFSDRIDSLRSPRQTNTGVGRPIRPVDVSLLEQRLAELHVEEQNTESSSGRYFAGTTGLHDLVDEQTRRRGNVERLTDIRRSHSSDEDESSARHSGAVPALTAQQRLNNFRQTEVTRETDNPLLSPKQPSYFTKQLPQSVGYAHDRDEVRKRSDANDAYSDTAVKELLGRFPTGQPTETSPTSLLSRGHQQSRHTVAERLLRTSPTTTSNGYWLQLTVTSAANLPFVKPTSSDGRPIPPSVFVSYRGNEHLESSAVVENTVCPVWNWSTQFLVRPERKNIVLKLWHRCPEKGDKVLGFVALDLSPNGMEEEKTGDYDLVDLSQSSTGTVRISLKPLRGENEETRTDLMTSFAEEQGVEEPSNAAMTSCRRDDEQQTVAVDSGEKATNTSMMFIPSDDCLPHPDRYMEMASRSFLVDKLRVNLNELDDLMKGFQPKH